MFATPTSYVVTPSRKPFMRIPERASTFLRDVKRRSQRKVKRSKSLVSRSNENKLSGSFVQLNEEEVRQKYIDDVQENRAWRNSNGGSGSGAENESVDDILHSTTYELPGTRRCSRVIPLPPSPCSTIYTPTAAPRHNTSTATFTTPRHSVRDLSCTFNNQTAADPQTPKALKFNASFTSPCSSSGHFRKISSPTLQQAWEDKENMLPPPTTPMQPPLGTPIQTHPSSSLLTPASRRRNTLRRSSIFTPSFRRIAQVTEEFTPSSYRKASLRTPSSCTARSIGTSTTPMVQHIQRTPALYQDSKKIKKLGGTAEETGQGRIIPSKQGYLYKKSGSSRMYRRKYVTLCDDGTMTYYPSFQAYVDNISAKEIHLQHVTVKVPGQKPTGLKSSSTTTSVGPVTRLSSASMAATPSRTGSTATRSRTDTAGSSSSDEFEKDSTSIQLDNVVPEKSTTVTANAAKTPKRKRHRLSDEPVESQPPSSLFELVIVSLDSRQWQFQVCSQEEGEEWVAAIQQQIHSSLQAGGDGSFVKYKNSDAEFLRLIPGNDVCADCGTGNPGWASLNLGTLICIECSGIHRNLGTHISKVRSLDLDSWSSNNLELMKCIGNRVANSVWEAALHSSNSSIDANTSTSSLEFWNKPGAESLREDKENFIKSKYLSKNLIHESVVRCQDLVNAINSEDMKLFLHTLVNLSCEELNAGCSTEENPLQYAISKQKLVFAQLLAWRYSDSTEIKLEDNGNFPSIDLDAANQNSVTYIADQSQISTYKSDQSQVRTAKQLNFDKDIVHESQLL